MSPRVDAAGVGPPAKAPIRHLAGIVPIVSVTYRFDDRIDFEDVTREVEYLVGLGVPAVGIGYGSDILRQNEAERDELAGSSSRLQRGASPSCARAARTRRGRRSGAGRRSARPEPIC